MKDSLIKLIKYLWGNNSRMDEAKNQINYMEYKEAKNNHAEQQEEKRIQKNEDSVNSLWDNFKHSHHASNIHITGCLLYTSDAADDEHLV